MEFRNPTCGALAFDGVIDECCAYLHAEPNAAYAITIGSDSDVRDGAVEFISAIVIHRKGHGARYFWAHATKPPFHSLRERIWEEVIRSTSLATSVLEALNARMAWAANIEVHVDVGEQGPTRTLIQELSGYVRAHGFIVCIKPFSYAASAVADRYT